MTSIYTSLFQLSLIITHQQFTLSPRTISWTSKDTQIVRPNRIEWESTSGLKNMGSVEFVSLQKKTISSSSSTTTTNEKTQMIMCFTFMAPRVVSSLFRRSNKIRKYTEDIIMMGMLADFRDVVMDEDL